MDGDRRSGVLQLFTTWSGIQAYCFQGRDGHGKRRFLFRKPAATQSIASHRSILASENSTALSSTRACERDLGRDLIPYLCSFTTAEVQTTPLVGVYATGHEYGYGYGYIGLEKTLSFGHYRLDFLSRIIPLPADASWD